MVLMSATVPDNFAEGQSFQVQTHAGMMQVVVPPGHSPGMTFQFEVPDAQPVAAQPVQAVAVAAPGPQVVIMQGGGGVDSAPPGAQPGGTWQMEQFTGTTTLIIFVVLLLFFPYVCCAPFCCPCDQRE
mmetsp:Transcript_38512/g.101602  ORF Transcript_38512/g.101602 Transcript_38512/m.101602 type:complete len:128 (-) Transcript_38512:778-1161(-)